eukprot:GHUV01020245.1.p1 GENE.GHUV01020245.1~~GHUV01020245.1.p1  ORF type:complete len:147 (-),score=30.85 GHUV01020245.1:1525-1965(-)
MSLSSLPVGQPHHSHTTAFAKTHKVGVCRRPYPQPYIKTCNTAAAAVVGQPYPSHITAFVKTHKVGVCRGPYPQPFIKACDAWAKRHTSENDPISEHPRDQLYAVFAMSDCGRDLEGFKLRDFDQARSMMLQVRLQVLSGLWCIVW